MSKLQNWPALLAETIKAAKQRPFSWGKFDCCLFAADCALSQTGVDPAAEFRGRYSTRIGAARVINKAGGLPAILDAKFRRIDSKQAQRGDLVLFNGPEGLTVGVMFSGIWATTETGARLVNADVKVTWRVE